MPRKRKVGRPKTRKAGGKRGRKPIFTPQQKSVLGRMINQALRVELRTLARSL